MCMCIVIISNSYGFKDFTCPKRKSKPKQKALQSNEIDIYLHDISDTSTVDGNNQSTNAEDFDDIHIHFDRKRKNFESSKKEPKCKTHKTLKNIEKCKCKCGRKPRISNPKFCKEKVKQFQWTVSSAPRK